MMNSYLQDLTAQIRRGPDWRPVGKISGISKGFLHISGISQLAHVGDQLLVNRPKDTPESAEILEVLPDSVVAMPYETIENIPLGARVQLIGRSDELYPSDTWIGRVIDPFAQPLDGKPLLSGAEGRRISAPPPNTQDRASLGARLNTGYAAFNTFLPIVEGQRLGLFAGSGVGKTQLLAGLSENMEADLVVIAMIGERGREVREFVENALGDQGRQRSIVIAATSDKSALIRRRCAWSAMTVAEHFASHGKRVLLLMDSVTRFAEAHRDIALAMGELPALRGYPPSTAQVIMSLCERAGPARQGEGYITALFSVLVAGSDFDEPIADILRGVLDGHVILDRTIAERGRYPAINLSKSVSRSLPHAASNDENEVLIEGRQLLGRYEQSEMMIRSGLYTGGTDPDIDKAIRIWPELDAFTGRSGEQSIADSFDRLKLLLRRAAQ